MKRKGWEGGDYHHGQLILGEPASLYKKLGASPLNSLNLIGLGKQNFMISHNISLIMSVVE